ncbi:hypothetical protein HD554DRAFT_2014029, partial [Boletus coccyginus]
DVICLVNIQHNCIDTACVDHMDVFLQQEWILTSRTKAIVKYLLTRSFFLNTYSIHNYIHIKSVLPEVLHDSPI